MFENVFRTRYEVNSQQDEEISLIADGAPST